MSEGAQEIHEKGREREREEEKWERGRESNKSPLDWGLGSWLDAPKRLIKMEFLMLIFVFSQKGWHILERHTACIFYGKSLHIFSCAPHCLVPCVTTARCSTDSRRIVAHYWVYICSQSCPSPHTIYIYESLFVNWNREAHNPDYNNKQIFVPVWKHCTGTNTDFT